MMYIGVEHRNYYMVGAKNNCSLALHLSLEQNLLIKIKANGIQRFLPIINKFIHSGNTEFCTPETNEFFEDILSKYLIVEDHFLQEIVKMF